MSGKATSTATVEGRLRRLGELVKQRAHPEWGREETAEILSQDPAAKTSQCPRYAGVVEESGDECVILAATLEELADDMAGRANNAIPILPVEAVDLDSGEKLAACRETIVTFSGRDGRHAPVPQNKLVLLTVEHRHGASFWLARDEAESEQLVQKWVSDWWEYEQERGDRLGDMPADPEEAVEAYFDALEDERFCIESVELPAGMMLAPAPEPASDTAHDEKGQTGKG